MVVIGAGHAGIEAALACARLGVRTACVTLRLDRIGHLPCNCSVGGPAKGHIAREVDALGGQMAITADRAVTHIRRVGTGKGPTVQTIRAHVCKDLYPARMRSVLESEPNLTLIEAAVSTILTDGKSVTGVELEDGSAIGARAAVITAGTFMNGLCHEGRKQTTAARHGDRAVTGLSRFLAERGVVLKRFKTGTTPRLRRDSIDPSRCLQVDSEPEAGPFSFVHDRLLNRRPLLPCLQTRTTPETHELLAASLDQSAMYSGAISGIGPRYCPSIEDKIVRFADKSSHPLFLEYETWDGPSVYVQGFSTSMPADVQLAAVRTIPGLERAEMIRPGYAVEYDCADPSQLTPQLMSRTTEGLFLAGQINGTSGYEEAAGQGIVAGISAAAFARSEPPVDFPRSQSFIGVMVDDLVTKGVEDPYRMLTARAEHRLWLRSDNADARLTPLAIKIGLASEERRRRFEEKQQAIASGQASLQEARVHMGHTDELAAIEEAPVGDRITFFELLKRPSMSVEKAERLAAALDLPLEISKSGAVREQIRLAALYEGYLKIQERQVKSSAALDAARIPDAFDYDAIPSLSFESREKLGLRRPQTVGQASRIQGIRASDITLLLAALKARKSAERRNSSQTETASVP